VIKINEKVKEFLAGCRKDTVVQGYLQKILFAEL